MSKHTLGVAGILVAAFVGYAGNASARFVQPDPVGLDGGINPYAYVEGNPLTYIDPLGLETCVLITVSPQLGFGTHAALYTSEGADGRPALYDPSGGYHQQSGSNDVINSDIVDGRAADIKKFAKYHKDKDKDTTEKSCKQTTRKQEEEFMEKARALKEAYGLTCARRVSTVIGNSPTFPKVKPDTLFPGNLLRDSRK